MREPLEPVAGVRFRNAGKIFYFHSAGMRLEPGEYVVVETARGPEVGRVVIAPGQVVVNELGREELKPILRLATDADIRRADALRARAEEVLPEARRLAGEAGFPARIDAAEFTLDGRRVTFSFTSEDRLDYREFLRRAHDRFAVKVDMKQLGARDRAKMAGGYGICGRELCCANWLATFPSISIRMAKEQELPLNPQKISGLCGRLLCCLSYEEEGYKEMRKTLPKLGQRCSTPTGEGKVISVNILRRQVTLIVEGQRIEVGDRDLGTVVRWDPAGKNLEPPPSISRADAIAAGMIEATEEDLLEAELAANPVEDWLPAPGGSEPAGRGRLPGGGPRKQSRPRPEQPQQEPGAAGGRREPQPAGQGRRRPRGSSPDGAPPGDRPARQGQPRDGAPREGGQRGQPRDGGQRAPRGQRPPQEPLSLPQGRAFVRGEGPAGDRPAPPPRPPRAETPKPPAADGSPADASSPGDGQSRRRRGRRGRGPAGNTSGDGAPPQSD
ncbi:MAG: hypothetical protein IT303_03005 [Dehalococcoidia bacterium]|nr:hypothetical protein [Dehalococcoidia bacterium]